MTIKMSNSEARKHGLLPVRKKSVTKRIGERLQEFTDDLESGVAISEKYKVTRLYRMTILNWTPVLCNQWRGKHWSVRHKLSKEQQKVLWYEGVKKFHVLPAKGKRRVSLEVHGWPKGRLPDADAFDKCLLDGLVNLGLLMDDGVQALDGRLAVKIVRDKERKTIITFEDCQ